VPDLPAQRPDPSYDEERFGFGEPARAVGEPPTNGERFALLLLALGIVLLAVVLLTPGPHGWVAFGAAFLPLVGGTLGVIHTRSRRWPHGFARDGLFFSSVSNRGLVGWFLAIVLTGFYVALYWYPALLARLVSVVDPVSRLLRRGPADPYFLYSFLYTLCVLVFGVRMFVKYRHARHQLVRTTSVMFFQLVFAFLIPQIMRGIDQPEFYFSYFWPLQPNYLFPSDFESLRAHPGGIGVFLFSWACVASFILVPVLTYFYGKRWYCSWVCGCGGLAETLGDPFRQLSSKSSRAWKIERWSVHLVLVFIVLVTASLWIDHTTSALGGFSETLRSVYKFAIILVFGGVAGVGFYPLLGSRVWCRFGCPQAAILGIFQRYFSRFRITTNGGQCMSCGNCSTHCEMGIDVRAYAQREANVVRASCVGCGVCAAVCPRGVLRLENGRTHADRFPGADKPLEAFRASLRGR
jgi:ferredoxin